VLIVPVVVNGEKNNLLIHLANNGNRNYTLVSAAASFHDPAKHWALVSSSGPTLLHDAHI
jgi:translocon-associated protein subunit alpha